MSTYTLTLSLSHADREHRRQVRFDEPAELDQYGLSQQDCLNMMLDAALDEVVGGIKTDLENDPL